MSLSNLWLQNENELKIKSINQIVGIAGDGKLLDDSETSKELRSFYRIIPSSIIESYILQCLENKFDSSGFVLQDLVNELGIRLEFEVKYGRYRGVSGKIGFDGIWQTKNGKKVIIEVKTTDTYRIDLNVLANYRKEYLKQINDNEEDISILIVVGRQDTGDLESQVRGSKYSWNIRIISTDALIKMLNIKENINDPKTLDKVHEIIVPKEYTRLDSIVDMLFSTTEEIIESSIIEDTDDEEDTKKEKKFTPVSYRNKCIERYKNLNKVNLIKRSYGLFETEDQENGLLCAISREYEKKGRKGYWFAIHPHQMDFLKDHTRKSVIFACGSENTMIELPYEIIQGNIEKLNQTILDDGRYYWHIHIHLKNGRYMWIMKKEFEDLDITDYLIH